MEYRCACLGLEGILENKAFAEYIMQDIQYTIPGVGSDYELRAFGQGIEFTLRRKGDMTGRRPSGMAVHICGDNEWTLVVDSVIDNESTAHEYMVCPKRERERCFPMRVICPDVLADIQCGDDLKGQVAAFIESGAVLKGDAEAGGGIAAADAHAVQIAGKISNIAAHTFEFEDISREYLRLDIETSLGTLSCAALPANLSAAPEINDTIVAKAYLSMDVAVSDTGWFRKHTVCRRHPNLPGDCEKHKYKRGCIRNKKNAMRVLARAISLEGAFRFGRCCTDTVRFTDISGDVQLLDRWAVVQKLNDLFADTKNAEIVLRVTDKSGTSCFCDGILVDKRQYLMLDTDAGGFVAELILLPAGRYAHDNELERYLADRLANAICKIKLQELSDMLSDDCCYCDANLGTARRYGAENIIKLYRSSGEYDNGRYEVTPTDEEIIEEKRNDLPGIFSGSWCSRIYKSGKLKAILFLRYDANGKVKNILLSRDGCYLKAYAEKSGPKPADGEKEFQPVDALLQRRFGGADAVRNMRRENVDEVDADGVYVWRAADEFVRRWFDENSYRLDGTELFDDCIGYACTRRGVEYAVYVYAYGEGKTAKIDGDYCALLRGRALSKGREILAICLRVIAGENDEGGVSFYIARYNCKYGEPEVWKLAWLGGRSVMLFYPGQETLDIIDRFEAAYNSRRIDILQALLDKNVMLKEMNGKLRTKRAAYGALANYYKNNGMMKTGYIRFDDAVYQKVPYIENFGYASFTIENHEKIVEIYFYPLDERYRELYETDEALTSHHMDDVPALETVEFLPPSEESRFSMLIGYANGEMRRYDAPGNFGNEEVVQWRGHAFTDEIFRGGRISGDLHADKDWLLRCYPAPYSGVGFSNGAGISAVELYHASYPVGEFEYRDGAEILVSQECAADEPFCVGRIRDMDPANPLYLFDRKRKIAKTLPAQYQETPVGVVPFCGGYSEGLIMVSAMGNADFQYRRAGYPCAGMWGWLNTELQTVIEPKYIYATNFRNGRAIVCKGEWSAAETNGGLQYWSENEGWGVIDRQEREIVPCRFDALYEIDGADRLYFVHEGGWENGRYAVYDAQGQNTLLKLDCSFNMEHRFNKLFVTDDDVLVFIACLPGADEDLVYAYDLQKREYIAYAVSDIGRALNGGSKAVIEKDGYYRILTARRTADVWKERSAD